MPVGVQYGSSFFVTGGYGGSFHCTCSGNTLDELKHKQIHADEHVNNIIADNETLRLAGEIENAMLEKIKGLRANILQKSSNMLEFMMKIEDLQCNNDRFIKSQEQVL